MIPGILQILMTFKINQGGKIAKPFIALLLNLLSNTSILQHTTGCFRAYQDALTQHVFPKHVDRFTKGGKAADQRVSF